MKLPQRPPEFTDLMSTVDEPARIVDLVSLATPVDPKGRVEFRSACLVQGEHVADALGRLVASEVRRGGKSETSAAIRAARPGLSRHRPWLARGDSATVPLRWVGD